VRSSLLTKDKIKPVIIVEVNCDMDLMTQLIVDEELEPGEVMEMLRKAGDRIGGALRKALVKRETQVKDE
jgi:hypothetical protein